MATMGCSESECLKILDQFRNAGLSVSDALLEQLARNYRLDASCDIDPNDIVLILSQPEPHLVLSAAVHDIDNAIGTLSSLLVEARQRVGSTFQVAAALLIVKGSPACPMPTFIELMSMLGNAMHPKATACYAWYDVPASVSSLELLLILTGIGVDPDSISPFGEIEPRLAARLEAMQAGDFDLPGFLRPKG